MLRRIADSGEPPVELPSDSAEETALQTGEQAFVLEERPFGIRFYQGRVSYFHPYAVLQAMSLSADSLKLVFAGTDVTLTGRGLHELYVRIAAQRVACIVEQGQRYATVSTASTHISRIERTPRIRKKKSPAKAEPDEATEPITED